MSVYIKSASLTGRFVKLNPVQSVNVWENIDEKQKLLI